MTKFVENFRDSARELKSVRTLCVAAIFIALNVTMDALNIRIQITESQRIGFGFLCNAMIGMLFGPVVGMISGIATDVLGYLVNSGGGGYFPGYTLTAIFGGLIWGVFLYRKQVTILRAFAAKALINLFCNIGLNSLWSYLLMGKAFWMDFPIKVIKNTVMLPVEIFLLVLVGGLVSEAWRRIGKGRSVSPNRASIK